MPSLAKLFDEFLAISHGRVVAPDYTLHADDAPADQDGWKYYPGDVEREDFLFPWKQPSGEQDAYPNGAMVSHNGTDWRSLIDANVWEPGISGWIEATAGTPAWIQPTGAHDAYSEGFTVAHNGTIWRSLIGANVWEPGVASWRETLLPLPGGVPVYPEWVQPSGAQDAYQIGDRVTHNGHVWKSTVANNVWEPGVYGWVAD